MTTDLNAQQQAAAVVLRLGGIARDIARDLTPQQLAGGDNVDFGQGPVAVDG